MTPAPRQAPRRDVRRRATALGRQTRRARASGATPTRTGVELARVGCRARQAKRRCAIAGSRTARSLPRGGRRRGAHRHRCVGQCVAATVKRGSRWSRASGELSSPLGLLLESLSVAARHLAAGLCAFYRAWFCTRPGPSKASVMRSALGAACVGAGVAILQLPPGAWAARGPTIERTHALHRIALPLGGAGPPDRRGDLHRRSRRWCWCTTRRSGRIPASRCCCSRSSSPRP